jgi:hypothetical protein
MPTLPIIFQFAGCQKISLVASAGQTAIVYTILSMVGETAQNWPTFHPITLLAKSRIHHIFMGLEAHGRTRGDALFGQ